MRLIGEIFTALIALDLLPGVWRVYVRRDLTWAEYLSLVAMAWLFPIAFLRAAYNRKNGWVWRRRG